MFIRLKVTFGGPIHYTESRFVHWHILCVASIPCEISPKTCNYFTTNIDRRQQFYLLPKIHKDPLNLTGRLIVSGSGGPTEKISQLVDHFIGKIVPLSQSYIILINILNGFTVQPGMLLYTLDITSLYTNIPHNDGIESIKKMLAIHKPPDSLPHNSYIIELLELVLTKKHLSSTANTITNSQVLQWEPN